MAGDIFRDAVLIFLIVYAIIHICYAVGENLIQKFSAYHHRDFLILPVSPGREELELDIRMAIKRSEACVCSLLILDMGLTEQEQLLLWRLSDPYSHIVIAKEENLAEKIKIADAINAAL